MRIQVRGQQVELTDALRNYAERRMLYALGRFSHAVVEVGVRLLRVHGHRHGEKECKILISAHGLGNLLIFEAGRDLYAVIDRAADRAARKLQRELARHREFERLAAL